MINNYLKIAFRSLAKNKAHTFINMSGLVLGMAIFLLITMYTRFELSYDEFHDNFENLYQISIDNEFSTAAPLASVIQDGISDFQTIVRVDYYYGGGRSPLLIIDDGSTSKKIKFRDVLFTDDAFFDMFSFKVIHGNIKTALKDPNSIVLTRSSSQQIFGIENSVGKSIHYIGDRNSKPEMDLTVTAIVEDVPENSTILFNAIIPFSKLYSTNQDISEDWSNWGYKTFVVVNKQNIKSFKSKLDNLWVEKVEEIWPGEKSEIRAVELSEIPFDNNSRRQLIYFIQLIGIFILSIAIINFINLTIAKSTTRAKEIGVRKVIGSLRSDLIKQFLLESIIVSLIVAPIAFLIVDLSKNSFYNIINKQIPFDLIHDPVILIILFVGVLLIGIIGGIYPALYLSSFKSVSILKGELTKGKKNNSLQFSLFVFQFVISVTLIICTILISNQIDYLKSKPLGFNNKNIVYFRQSEQINKKYDVFKERLVQHSNIISVARSNHALGENLNIGTFHEVNGEDKFYSATTVDPNFISTMGIEVIAGRDFSWEVSSDKKKAVIVNETFVKEFELADPIGTEINFIKWKAKIIGVVKDFHYNSFHAKVKPSALLYADWNSQINVKINNHDITNTIKIIEEVWNELSPIIPFDYKFLDNTYDKLYKSEDELQQIITYFSIIAIIIACLGLFSLISYSCEQRTKEIGIRKVLGASVTNVISTLTKKYLQWIITATIIAIPISYYLMDIWLQDYAYRIEMNMITFIIAGAMVITIALVTISSKAIKAAIANPVDSLRNE
jgi:putative ABC transport system permease protein